MLTKISEEFWINLDEIQAAYSAKDYYFVSFKNKEELKFTEREHFYKLEEAFNNYLFTNSTKV